MTTSTQILAYEIPGWNGLIHKPNDWGRETADDMRSEYVLLRDAPLNPEEKESIGLFNLREADFWVEGQVVREKLEVSFGLAGQKHAERTQFGPPWIPKEWEQFSPLLFAGTLWLRTSDQTLWVPGLNHFDDMSSGWEFCFYKTGGPAFYAPQARLVRIVGM
ncbi:MAG: hypothetical protein Q7S63_03000 [bacterium]|nr:hypothetical protein [bacterium]